MFQASEEVGEVFDSDSFLNSCYIMRGLLSVITPHARSPHEVVVWACQEAAQNSQHIFPYRLYEQLQVANSNAVRSGFHRL